MNTVLVVIDGADIEDYQYLSCKNWNTVGHNNNTPNGSETDSMTCILNMLGYPVVETGRAYYEAIAVGYEVKDTDLIFRCNGIDFTDGTITSSTESKQIESTDEFTFIHIGGYKNLLIIHNANHLFDTVKTFPPHDNLGVNIKDIMPIIKCKSVQKILNNLIIDYQLYPWGQSIKCELPSFFELHKISGAVVCKTEIVKGIALSTKMFCPNIETATADIDTDLLAKTALTLKLAKEYDFTMLHINGLDEACHRKNLLEKNFFLKRIDSEIIKLLQENLGNDVKLIVTSDHATDCLTGKHINKPVNYYIYR